MVGRDWDPLVSLKLKHNAPYKRKILSIQNIFNVRWKVIKITSKSLISGHMLRTIIEYYKIRSLIFPKFSP